MHKLFSLCHTGCVRIPSPQSGWRGWGLWDFMTALAGKPSLSGQSLQTLSCACVFPGWMVCIGLAWADPNLVSATCLLGELSHSVFAGPHHRTWHKTPWKTPFLWEWNRSQLSVFHSAPFPTATLMRRTQLWFPLNGWLGISTWSEWNNFWSQQLKWLR